jgi:type III secretion protein J
MSALSAQVRSFVRRALVSAVCLLCACGGEVTLQSGLSDGDANEIHSLLRQAGIVTAKSREKAGVTLSVGEKDLARASDLVRAAGLPRRQLSLLGDVFKKDGMISTPLEERARYLHGLSQELEYTLSRIDRVVLARVHVVLPERVAPGEPVKPSSASVFLKYRPPLDEDVIVPRVRRLVTTSIPGLAADADERKLSVVLLPAEAPETTVEWAYWGPFQMELSSAARASRWAAWLGGLAALAAAAAALALAWRRPATRARLQALLRRRLAPEPVASEPAP